MINQISVAREAEKILDRLDRTTERRIRQRMELPADDPSDPRLSAPLTERRGLRKSRVGGWRILFAVESRHQGHVHPDGGYARSGLQARPRSPVASAYPSSKSAKSIIPRFLTYAILTCKVRESNNKNSSFLRYAQDTEMLGCGARLGRMRRSTENIRYEDPSNRSCGYHRQ